MLDKIHGYDPFTCDIAWRAAVAQGHAMGPVVPWVIEAPYPEMRTATCGVCLATVSIDGQDYWGSAVTETCQERQDAGAP